jgi:membrane protease YdiL (CAAX protease family)
MQQFSSKTIRILIFFIISLSSSFLFRYDVFEIYKNWNLSPILNVFKSLLEGIGPFFGALLVTKIFSIKSEITFMGKLGLKSLLMLSIPVLILSIIGVSNSQFNNHFYGLLLGLWIGLYGILEETGWRGYLHNELKHLKPLVKYSIVGALWYIWHLTFLGETTIVNELFIAFILIISSWGIGYVTDKSKSIFAAACFHIIGNVLGLSPLFGNVLNMNTRIIIVLLCVVIWIYILRKIKK